MFTESDDILDIVACVFKLTLHDGATKVIFVLARYKQNYIYSKAEILLSYYNGDRNHAWSNL